MLTRWQQNLLYSFWSLLVKIILCKYGFHLVSNLRYPGEGKIPCRHLANLSITGVFRNAISVLRSVHGIATKRPWRQSIRDFGHSAASTKGSLTLSRASAQFPSFLSSASRTSYRKDIKLWPKQPLNGKIQHSKVSSMNQLLGFFLPSCSLDPRGHHSLIRS